MNQGTTTIDQLTGLLDHRSFLGALSDCRSLCFRRDWPLTLALLDIRRFRQINADHSRSTGDAVLASVSASMQQELCDSAILGRYSWDCFAMALTDMTEQQALDVATRIQREAFCQPIEVQGQSLTVRCCLGIAQSSFAERTGDLVERTEQALTAAKEGGGARVVTYSSIARRVAKPRDLNQASMHTVSQWIRGTRQQLKLAYMESTRVLVGAVEAKDPFTKDHSLRVSDYAAQLAGFMGCSSSQIESIKTAAILHDIGKIGVPDAILQKRDGLNDEEFDLIKEHPDKAVQILGPASFLETEIPIIKHHHERYDGRGYPDGLAGNQIPFGARILAVADSIDAMASPRVYRPEGFSRTHITAELRKQAGKQWDPLVIDAAIEWLNDSPDALHIEEAFIIPDEVAPAPDEVANLS